MAITKEQLARLKICAHGSHQIDENKVGLNAGGARAPTCPDHPTFNAAFAARQDERLAEFKRTGKFHD